MGLFHHLVVSSLPLVPRPIMRRLAARYIAGETLEEALAVLAANQAKGFGGVLDILGEDVADEAAARAVLSAYKTGVSAIASNEINAYVSVKPTHFGLRISAELARELYSDLLTHCHGVGQLARVEMEDASTTDATLELFRSLRTKHDNVGLVLQSRLFRTLRDIEELPDTTCDVRMVKGIYLEPSDIAHTEPGPIRDAFVDGCNALFERGHDVGFGTHDKELGDRLVREVRERNIEAERYCFEVLLGVQEGLWRGWRDEGHRVLVYVPYGPEWRQYSQRRLGKNPEVLRHVMRGMFGG